ncbi:MAG TPA: hypothetical protein PKW95_05750 [bacterium]|nr:hypothetical protein [bacterium]
MNRRWWTILLALLLTVALPACDIEFDPPAVIKTQRFLGIRVEPLEAAPGDEVTFTALVVNKDGSLYEGPVAWAVVAGNQMREEGETDAGVVAYLQSGPDDPFVWTVPAWEELTAQFGPLERDGSLLTVAAAAFKGGDPQGEPLTAFKLFVLADREQKRYVNPKIEKMLVLDDRGVIMTPDEDGQYNLRGDEATVWIEPDLELDDLTYHWFAADEEFDPDFERHQKIERGDKRTLDVYCVMRRVYRFRHGANAFTYLTGMDWQSARLRFDSQ